MEQFIKVSLVGQGWAQCEYGKHNNSQTVLNIIATHLRGSGPFDGSHVESRNITISLCDQLDKIHFIQSDQELVIPI